ncbi:WD40/YVTN repeat and Bromo-WDR9-I-like domain-containing protein [Actinidia rufa]|uniref:WD40/YVTN repeat and Bromo-WDR9-I-like domain-containing protein n=1 Tax=Actinidia rufa TaxID=165716 RepID=A0A7J0GL12_9ERIC|nr:WD40/YVTN repeat and Bromo-WDR9-I-like domain-containing protein [Actinidia rufa]
MPNMISSFLGTIVPSFRILTGMFLTRHYLDIRMLCSTVCHVNPRALKGSSCLCFIIILSCSCFMNSIPLAKSWKPNFRPTGGTCKISSVMQAVMRGEMLGMIPYPEPYQSMYQQRRLGALGIEWRPSSVRFAVGADLSLDQGYQMFPVLDLDLLIDPLPEFIDAMDWEPEHEVQSDDTDSEYNVTEEYSSGGEQGSLSTNSSGNPECSSEDSGVEGTHKDALRRSKRKKQKTEGEIMTSSGRRIKRKNLDDGDGDALRKNWRRKSRQGHKASRKKSSSLKTLRPQRAAARNALTLFSRITGGVPTDGEEEEEGSENSSESEATLQDSNIDSEESDKSLQNKRHEHSKGKEVLVDESEGVVRPHEDSEHRISAGNRGRLVLKFPVRDLNKSVPAENTKVESKRTPNLVGSSSKSPREANEVNKDWSQDPDYLADDANYSGTERSQKGEHINVDNHLDLFEGYDQKIKWGGFRARTSKRLKMGDPLPLTEYGKFYSSAETPFHGGLTDEMVSTNQRQVEHGTTEVFDGAVNGKEHSSLENHSELKENPTPSTKLRIRSKIMSEDERSKVKSASSMEDGKNGGSDARSENPDVKQNLNLEVPDNDGTIGPDQKALAISVAQIDGTSRNSCDKMYSNVYRRSKSSRARSNPQDDSGGVNVNTSNVSNHNLDLPEVSIDGIHHTRSMGLRATIRDANDVGHTIKLREDHDGSNGSSAAVQNASINACNEPPCEEWRSGSRINVGLRSTRNRRSSYHIRDSSPPYQRKSHQDVKNSSWLMLSTHEEGSRYIPQLGDEVAYLRQGHQEFISRRRAKVGHWETLKSNIRAVEFCRVQNLEYAPSGGGEICCRMTLQVANSSSSVTGKTFTLTLPELNDFPDFLVERKRYDAAMQRNWTPRDKCQIWWKNPGEENGSWWKGRIVSVKPKSPEFPDSPWERYDVRYSGNPPETFLHSPWELHDVEKYCDDKTQWEPPHIDNEIRDKMLSFLDKLNESGEKDQDRYGIQKLKQVSQKPKFLNRFDVPLSLEVIHARLENNYYRSVEAMKHDISVMLSNAEAYFFDKKAELSTKMKRLSDWFDRTLSSL